MATGPVSGNKSPTVIYTVPPSDTGVQVHTGEHAQLAGRVVPVPAHGLQGEVGGPAHPVAPLAAHAPQAAPAQAPTQGAVGVLNRMINLFAGGQGSPAVKDQLDHFSEAYELLTAGPAAGDALMAQIDGIRGAGNALRASTQPRLESFPPELRTQVQELAENLAQQLDAREAYLRETLSNSPLSASAMYQGKAQICQAATHVIDKALQRPDLSPEQRDKLELAKRDIFQARATQLQDEAVQHRDELAQARDILGRKPMGLFAQLIHPARKNEQKQALAAHVRDLVGSPEHRTASATTAIDEQTVIEATLAKVFSDAGIPAPHVGHDLHHAMNEVLNAQAWRPIDREIHLQSGAQTVTARSQITPAAAFIGSYQGHGFNAHSTTEYHHAANLAQTQLCDAGGARLFCGTRHAVLSAFGINAKEVGKMGDDEVLTLMRDLLPEENWVSVDGHRDEAATLKRVRADSGLVDAMRRTANRNRALELAGATLMSDPALLAAAEQGQTVTLDIASLSLLTPDCLRPLKGDPNSDERQMFADQQQAWQDVSGPQALKVSVPTADGGRREITVQANIRPLAFNYGVNAGAVGGLSAIAGGWDTAQRANTPALTQLLGENPAGLADGHAPEGLIGEKLAHLGAQIASMRAPGSTASPDALQAAEKKYAQALEVARQIGEIVQDESFRHSDGEAYKMPTRLAILCEMLDIKIAFNCKSGKDRTGELDAEIKHFRLQMEMTGQVPQLGRTRSPEELAQFHEVVTHSGNFEMQRLNTGYAGYKLKGVGDLYAQFGGNGHDDLTADYLGLSGYTAS